MAPRLKVFVTSDGLTDYVVATTSKAKALAAWGVSQDAFKQGRAQQTDDPALVKAASARPGEVLRRPVRGARGKIAQLKPAKPAKPKGPTKAQMKRIADLEAQLARLDAWVEGERAKLAKYEAVVAKRRASLEAKAAAERSRLQARLQRVRPAPG